MNSYIPLPNMVKGPNAKLILTLSKYGFSQSRLIQGSVFYSAFVDVAVGEFVHDNPQDAYQRIESLFLNQGMEKETVDLSWDCLVEYMKLFPSPVFQYSLYSMVIHWDWFISKLSEFVCFARLHDNVPSISNRQTNKLHRLGMKNTDDQLSLLSAATGLNFNIDNTKLDSFKEMLLVRNLGMHNEWEVDQFYLDRTRTQGWKLGQLRTIKSTDLYRLARRFITNYE